MTQKEFFKKVNTLAKENMERAKGWLDCYNRDHNTEYTFLNKRVVFKVTVHGHTEYHDAYVWATDESIF